MSKPSRRENRRNRTGRRRGRRIIEIAYADLPRPGHSIVRLETVNGMHETECSCGWSLSITARDPGREAIERAAFAHTTGRANDQQQ